MRRVKTCWSVLGIFAMATVTATGCGKKENAPTAAEVSSPIEAKAPAPPETEKAPAPTPDKKAEEPPKEAAPTEPAKVEAKPTDDAAKAPGARPKVAKKPNKAEKEAGAAARRDFNRLLEEGRKAVKADDALTGMTKLEEALTKIPGHPSALGELGWAAYRAGPEHFERSLDATRRALSLSKKPKQQGALWYNLGRVFEDQGNLANALDAYRESLAVRPGNAAVQERLEGVLAKVGGKTGNDGLEKLDDLCMTLRTEQDCDTAASAEGQIVHSCECATEILGPEEGFGRAALVRVTGANKDGIFGVDSTYLAVEIASRWHLVTMVGNDWTPGAFGISNESTRGAFELKKVGDQTLLWVLYENTFIDLDMAGLITSSEWSRTLTVCGLLEGAMTCLGVPLGSGSAVAIMEVEGEEPPPDLPTPFEKRLAHKATLNDDGTITIAFEAKEGEVEAELVAPASNLTFAQLAAQPRVVKFPL